MGLDRSPFLRTGPPTAATIDQTLWTTSTSSGGLFQLEFDQDEPFRGTVWGLPEIWYETATFRWTIEARVLLPLPSDLPAGAYQLSLNVIRAFDDELLEQTTLLLNGQALTVNPVPGGPLLNAVPNELWAFIPEGRIIPDETAILTIAIPKTDVAVMVDSADERALGLAIDWLCIERVNEPR